MKRIIPFVILILVFWMSSANPAYAVYYTFEELPSGCPTSRVDISGDNIVWMCPGEGIYQYKISSGITNLIVPFVTNSIGDRVVVSGDNVTFVERDGSNIYHLMRYDPINGPVEIDTSSANITFDIDDDTVAFRNEDDSGLYTHDSINGVVFRKTINATNNLAISGDNIVHSEGSSDDVLIYNILTDSTTILDFDQAAGGQLCIDGDNLIFKEGSEGFYQHKISSGISSLIINGFGFDLSVSDIPSCISGDNIVFMRRVVNSSSWQIYI